MKINHIKVANHLPYGVEFQTVGFLVSHRGRQYQLCVGEKHTPISKRIVSFVKASLATICTGFVGLCFTRVRKHWGNVFHCSRTVKRYIPIPLPPAKVADIQPPSAKVGEFNPMDTPKEVPSVQKSSPVGKVETSVSFLNESIQDVAYPKEDASPKEERIKESTQELENGLAPPEEKNIKEEEIVQKKREFEDLLDAIMQDSKRDLFLNDDYIEKKYGINSRLASLPEDDKKLYQGMLNNIVNRAYLEQFLRNKGKIVMGQDLEEFLLRYLLGSKIDNFPYKDKEAIYSNFKKIIQAEVKPEHFILSNASFRQLLDGFALEARLHEVQMTDKSQIAKFNTALLFMKNTAKYWKEIANTVSLSLSPLIKEKAPLAAKDIYEHFQYLKSHAVKMEFANIFWETIRKNFFDSDVDIESFGEIVEEKGLSKEETTLKLINRCEGKKKHPVLQEKIKLYEKLIPYLKAEMRQGFLDKQEVLGNGVCLALCFKLLEELQLKPDAEGGNQPVIEPIDRFRQALYKVNIKKIGDGFPMPKEWLNNSAFQRERVLFDVGYDPKKLDFNVNMSFPWTMNSLKQSNGWTVLSLRWVSAGHAVLMRLDQEHEKAWLFDPNVGLLCFEADGKTFDQARSECLDCFKDICSNFYPLLNRIRASQLIPKNTHAA